MSKPAKNTAEPLSPLDQLSVDLDTEMRAVNALIIERMDSPVKLIPQLASYLIAAGGKRIRPLLTLASTSIYNGDMQRAHKLAAAVEFIHTATLLHDDVVDESEQRRGQDAANLVFGNQASVLVGDFLFSRAFQLMTEDGSIDVLNVLANASAVIAQGEVLQLSTANTLNNGLDIYLEVIRSKTAALFAAACEVGPMVSDAAPAHAKALSDYGMNMGIAFQIADDTLDYTADEQSLGKTVGDDFREGKATAPVLLSLKDADADEMAFWERVLVENKQTPDDLQKALEIINRHDGFAKANDLALEYKDKALAALNAAPDSVFKTHLENLADYVVSRSF